MLESGTRLGQEFAEAWGYMKREAEAGAAMLGELVGGPLAVDVASAGEGCCTGETRSRIVEN